MKHSLSFDWSFVEGFDDSYLLALPKNAKKVDLPHNAVDVPLNYFSETCYQKRFTYEKYFDLDDDLSIHSILFEGVMLEFDLYLNGKSLGHFVSGYFPIEVDISEATKKKNNRLLLIVDGRENPAVPPFGHVVDYLTFAGIYRPVYLISHGKEYLKDIRIEAKADGTLKIFPTLEGKGKPKYKLYDGYHLIESFDEEEKKFDGIEPWSIANPKLYRLETSFGGETRSDMVGFRDVLFKEDGFYLNGAKTKLIGLNRHQNYPYVGPAMPKSAQQDDARILKEEFGVNLVRTSHYADSEDFLDECDRLGLLVVDEVPGWQHIGLDQEWRNCFFDFIRRLVLKEKNHPSLIAYGLRVDESPDDEELNRKANEIQKELDPSRQSLGVRNFKDSKCYDDVYAYNDFSCSNIKHGLDDPKTWKGAKGLPKLVSEHNGHMFPTKSFDSADRRLEHALRHARVLDDAYKYDSLSGVIGWCAFDYNTHKEFGSDNHICYHGVADIFRNPKLAAAVYASQNEERDVFEASSLLTVGDVDECLYGDVYCFTNADYVELYLGNEKIGSFYPDKKNFPHLPHPPIHIDDFIGERFVEQLSDRDSKAIKKALNLSAIKGFSRMTLFEKLPVLFVALKNRLSFNDFYKMYNKYIQNWGEDSSTYTFKAYRGEEVIAEKTIGPSTEFHLDLSTAHGHLKNADTYDVARVKIEFKDEYGTRMPYAFNVLTFETTGPIEVIGPKSIALQGGSASVYVRSLPTAKETVGTLKVKAGDLEESLLIVVE
ncbi:MAG: glycoside hydrolase family 2 protein [Bacilli bacterium]|nr:glycoside hydrolase family 2 protein [Bacilli bacterium]